MNEVLIIGGTKGIGLAVATRLAQLGSRVFLNYAADDSAARAAHESMAGFPGECVLIKGDASKPGCANEIARAVSRQTDKLSGLVYSAVVPSDGMLMAQPMEEIERTIQVSGLGLLHIARATHSLLRDGGSVVYLSGGAVDLVLPSHGAIALSKALGECLVRQLAIECAEDNIRFNTLRSGPVDTPFFREATGHASPPLTPAGRALNVDDVAASIEFLLSPASTMVRGQQLVVDGGLSKTFRRGFA